MDKRFFSIVFFGVLAGASIVLLLFIVSRFLRTEYGSNGFVRTSHINALIPEGFLDTGHSSFLIIGGTSSSIFLARNGSRSNVLVVSKDLKDTSKIKLSIPDIRRMSPVLAIDSPDFYMMDGGVRCMAYGTLGCAVSTKSVSIFSQFTASVPISPHSYVIRTYDTTLRQNILAKISIRSGEISRYVLEKQKDGIFCTDGKLKYDFDKKLLMYMYYYRNQFVCLDTNLNVVYKGNTIDTTTHANIDVSEIESKRYSGVRTSMLSTPPRSINKNLCITDSLLLIQSSIAADNEDIERFENSSVLDVYSMLNRKYKFTLYIPDLNGRKIQSLYAKENRLYIVVDKSIFLYRMNF